MTPHAGEGAARRGAVLDSSSRPFSADVDPFGDRRDVVPVGDEQHVPAGRRDVGVTGQVQVHGVPVPLIGSATNRWFGSDWWVTAAGLISSADLIGVLVLTV